MLSYAFFALAHEISAKVIRSYEAQSAVALRGTSGPPLQIPWSFEELGSSCEGPPLVPQPRVSERRRH
jgi:hypothetical protein